MRYVSAFHASAATSIIAITTGIVMPKSWKSDTPLTDAVMEADIAAVETALEAGYVPIGVTPAKGQTGAMSTGARARHVNVRTFRDRMQVYKNAHGREPDWNKYHGTLDAIALIEAPEKAPDPRDQEIIGLRDEVRSLKSQVDSIHRDNLSHASVREFITDVQSQLPVTPSWKVDLKVNKSGSAGVPLTLWSDWHGGEVVFKEQVSGINEFNMAIFQNRVRRLVETIINICFTHTANPSYPGIVVCLGGDMISGMIHEEFVETMEGPLTAQILEVYRMLAWALETLADKFGAVFVPCVVGNHGRMTAKPRAKNRPLDSFEHMIYHLLADHFKDDNRIEFYIPENVDARFEVAGTMFLLTHGDSMGARGGDGIIGAIGPIVRGEKRVRDVASFTDEEYDIALIGHWHTGISTDSLYVNRALKGYDEYAKLMLRCRPELPGQWLLFVHPKYGIIDQRMVLLEDRAPRPDACKFVNIP